MITKAESIGVDEWTWKHTPPWCLMCCIYKDPNYWQRSFALFGTHTKCKRVEKRIINTWSCLPTVHESVTRYAHNNWWSWLSGQGTPCCFIGHTDFESFNSLFACKGSNSYNQLQCSQGTSKMQVGSKLYCTRHASLLKKETLKNWQEAWQHSHKQVFFRITLPKLNLL